MMDARESRKRPLGWFVAYCGTGLVIAFFVLPIAFLDSIRPIGGNRYDQSSAAAQGGGGTPEHG